MSDPRPIRITNPTTEQWIEENIPKGKFNEWANNQLDKGALDGENNNQQEQQEQKTERHIALFSMFMFFVIGCVFICYALAPYQILIQSTLSILFFIAGVLIFIYIGINYHKKEKTWN